MKNTLLIFLNGFPYNNFEPFFEPEYPLYKRYFDHVLIVTNRYKTFKKSRQLNDDFFTVIDDTTMSKNVIANIEAFPLVLFDVDFYREISKLIKSKRFSSKRLYDLYVTTACGNHRALLVKRWVKKNPSFKIVSIYSYWLNIPAYAAIKTKTKYLPECKTVTRAHGFDLYEERYETKYLPYQEFICNKIDKIVCISKDGKNYLDAKYQVSDKSRVIHLGALDQHYITEVDDRSILKIVSCSRAVKVKRLERIIESLGKIKDIDIEWTHIGGGELLQNLMKESEKLPSNIKATFTDTMTNVEVYEFYQSHEVHAFINVSESEGLPVTIMEAMSFGIPAIGTNVGGMSEIIANEYNGFLLDAAFDSMELVEKLHLIRNISKEEYSTLKTNARLTFEKEYDATFNADYFIKNYLVE